MGDLSPHFSLWEFRDRRTGATKRPSAELIRILEDVRSQIGRPLPIISGYRTKATNKIVGGATRSLHLRARAADIPAGLVRPEQAVAARAGGVGVRNGWVVHLDDRRGPGTLIFNDP